MNWEAVGALAELVGAVGVVASLFYLGSQIRSNTRAVKASVYRDTNNAARDIDLLVVRDPEVGGKAYQNNLRLLCAQPGFEEFWEALPFGFDQNFQRLIDSHIAESKS